jgi:hypothetical protein
MVSIDERIASLVSATMASGTAIEQELLGKVIDIGPVITSNVGLSAPPLVIMDTRRSAFFKRFCDQKPNLCSQYGHDRMESPLNEVAAWRLAYAMGDPWRHMLPTAVLRKIDGRGGALINDKHGAVDNRVFQEAESQVKAAALWDALIGNQDRNGRNFRYDHSSRRLGLIDHGFAFARPGDLFHTSLFHAVRKGTPGAQTLTRDEQEALDALVSSNLYGLRTFIEEDRAEALDTRAKTMLNKRLILPVGTF